MVVQNPQFVRLSGLPNFGAKARYTHAKFIKNNQNFVFVTSEEEDSDVFSDSIKAWGEIEHTPLTSVYFSSERLIAPLALYNIINSKAPYAVACEYESLDTPLPFISAFKKMLKTIERGDNESRGALIDTLAAYGYERVDFTESAGEFAVRGSVMDIFCPNESAPLRLYFSGNKIETISSFEIDTQNTKGYRDSLTIIPLEFAETPCTIKDYVKDAVFVFDNPPDDFNLKPYESKLVISPFPTENNAGLKPNIKFNANFALLKSELESLEKQVFAITISCLNRGELDRLSDIFLSNEIKVRCRFIISPLTQGFYDSESKEAFITSAEIFNRSYHAASLIKNFDLEGTKRVHFKDLVVGDYIVHQRHGIGKYMGMQMLEGDVPTDCLIIEFRRASRLYVPVQDFTKVQKYIGVKGKAPALSTLGGGVWSETKKRVKENAREAAEEILKMEAERAASGASPLYGDGRMETEFADSFPYEETPDQAKANEEILQDLLKQKSMDRVLVGDVGFGKTEVAMRAALRCALSGKQTLILVPTTILAAQHYKTFQKRFAGFPISIETLSRFQTKAEQKIVVERIRRGTADIVVGTHRLLSKDISFPRLGLAIIDEEHRFGVKQKEKIKAKCRGVHTLMLSATPIPRTLNQSLSNIKDFSLIQTPPHGRVPIKTILMPWNGDVAANAVRQEIARGGQVYYVYNKVASMETRKVMLEKLIPEARICMAHGQMKESELEDRLWDFYNKKYDILLASTIIENGLDISNVNTLIVEEAHNFGLAQLYQLRGRIGRGDKKAYCYLFHSDTMFLKKEDEIMKENTYDELLAFTRKKKEKDPTEDAKKRLTALSEFSELGSGFKLALRDLEIRGAGSLLGIKQHGHASEIGLNMYLDLVANEVKKLKGIPVSRELNATVNAPIAAFIPPEYIPDDNERLRFYKELMSANETENAKILDRMQDIAGPAPEEVRNMAAIALLARDAGEVKIRHIEIADDFTEFYFTRQFKMPAELMTVIMSLYPGRVKFIPSPKGDGMNIDVNNKGNYLAFARELVNLFKKKYS
ncbi:transcription-repair coupling factor (superfamily II helicase) [Parelusimicrobium proximum]|uniref:DEAD/DEAH box helicase n=1 Tax=Parelusimicrobium proximum TaxID=3228953 RepID=UPI003D181B90